MYVSVSQGHDKLNKNCPLLPTPLIRHRLLRQRGLALDRKGTPFRGGLKIFKYCLDRMKYAVLTHIVWPWTGIAFLSSQNVHGHREAVPSPSKRSEHSIHRERNETENKPSHDEAPDSSCDPSRTRDERELRWMPGPATPSASLRARGLFGHGPRAMALTDPRAFAMVPRLKYLVSRAVCNFQHVQSIQKNN